LRETRRSPATLYTHKNRKEENENVCMVTTRLA